MGIMDSVDIMNTRIIYVLLGDEPLHCKTYPL